MNKGFLVINEPCQEGWENMSISEKGRFCVSCQKEVRDFTNSDVEDIRRAYAESNGELCGHVPSKLLQEEHFSKHLQQNHFDFLKRFFIAAVFCFGASLFTIDGAKASTFYKLKITFLKINDSDTVLVKGEVRDHKNREQLPFAIVSVLFNDSVVVTSATDIEGKYALKIPKEYSKVDIKVVYAGYMTKIMKGISIAPGKQIVVDFELEQDVTYITNGIIVIDRNHTPANQEPAPTGKTIKRDEYKRMPK